MNWMALILPNENIKLSFPMRNKWLINSINLSGRSPFAQLFWEPKSRGKRTNKATMHTQCAQYATLSSAGKKGLWSLDHDKDIVRFETWLMEIDLININEPRQSIECMRDYYRIPNAIIICAIRYRRNTY